MTADTESMWRTLGGLALHAKNLPVAERCLFVILYNAHSISSVHFLYLVLYILLICISPSLPMLLLIGKMFCCSGGCC